MNGSQASILRPRLSLEGAVDPFSGYKSTPELWEIASSLLSTYVKSKPADLHMHVLPKMDNDRTDENLLYGGHYNVVQVCHCPI